MTVAVASRIDVPSPPHGGGFNEKTAMQKQNTLEIDEIQAALANTIATNVIQLDGGTEQEQTHNQHNDEEDTGTKVDLNMTIIDEEQIVSQIQNSECPTPTASNCNSAAHAIRSFRDVLPSSSPTLGRGFNFWDKFVSKHHNDNINKSYDINKNNNLENNPQNPHPFPQNQASRRCNFRKNFIRPKNLHLQSLGSSNSTQQLRSASCGSSQQQNQQWFLEDLSASRRSGSLTGSAQSQAYASYNQEQDGQQPQPQHQSHFHQLSRNCPNMQSVGQLSIASQSSTHSQQSQASHSSAQSSASSFWRPSSGQSSGHKSHHNKQKQTHNQRQASTPGSYSHVGSQGSAYNQNYPQSQQQQEANELLDNVKVSMPPIQKQHQHQVAGFNIKTNINFNNQKQQKRTTRPHTSDGNGYGRRLQQLQQQSGQSQAQQAQAQYKKSSRHSSVHVYDQDQAQQQHQQGQTQTTTTQQWGAQFGSAEQNCAQRPISREKQYQGVVTSLGFYNQPPNGPHVQQQQQQQMQLEQMQSNTNSNQQQTSQSTMQFQPYNQSTSTSQHHQQSQSQFTSQSQSKGKDQLDQVLQTYTSAHMNNFTESRSKFNMGMASPKNKALASASPLQRPISSPMYSSASQQQLAQYVNNNVQQQAQRLTPSKQSPKGSPQYQNQQSSAAHFAATKRIYNNADQTQQSAKTTSRRSPNMSPQNRSPKQFIQQQGHFGHGVGPFGSGPRTPGDYNRETLVDIRNPYDCKA